ASAGAGMLPTPKPPLARALAATGITAVATGATEAAATAGRATAPAGVAGRTIEPSGAGLALPRGLAEAMEVLTGPEGAFGLVSFGGLKLRWAGAWIVVRSGPLVLAAKLKPLRTEGVAAGAGV